MSVEVTFTKGEPATFPQMRANRAGRIILRISEDQYLLLVKSSEFTEAVPLSKIYNTSSLEAHYPVLLEKGSSFTYTQE